MPKVILSPKCRIWRLNSGIQLSLVTLHEVMRVFWVAGSHTDPKETMEAVAFLNVYRCRSPYSDCGACTDQETSMEGRLLVASHYRAPKTLYRPQVYKTCCCLVGEWYSSR